MRRSILACFLLSSLMASFSWASSGKILFDDFESGYLHKTKWWPREYVLEVVDGQAIFKLGNSTGMGAEIRPGLFDIPLQFLDPNSIDTIECHTTIVATKLDSPGSYSAARVGGYFYNRNDAGGPAGDIFAHIRVGDLGNGGLEASWIAYQVVDDAGTLEMLPDGQGNLVPPGGIQYNTPVIVRISYDGEKRIVFSANGQSATFDGPDRKRPPVTLNKGFAATIVTADSQNDGFIWAKLANVYINNGQSMYDDFSVPAIDLSKWRQLEFVREASKGYLRANIRGVGSNRQCTTALSQSDAPYVEAKVRIDGSSQLSADAWGMARIQGYYYNESRGPGSGQTHNGYEGNVFAQMALRYFSDGTLRAYASVERSNDATEGSFTYLFKNTFSTQILLDADYILSILFEDNRLTFSCNGENVTYNIQSPIYPAYGEHRHLRSRVYLAGEQSGYIRAAFDDVYTGYPEGDINFDKQVSLADAILALQLTAGMEIPNQVFIEADLSRDSKIGLEEAVYVLQKLSNFR